MSSDPQEKADLDNSDVKSLATLPGEPGSARFGNFMNYYSFNPADRRVSLIPSSLVDDILSTLLPPNTSRKEIMTLDIGCNAGQLTFALHEHFSRADHKVCMLGIDIDKTLIERCNAENPTPDDVTFAVADVMNDYDVTLIDNYLTKKDVDCFDMIFCFSVTLWIHLNHGDDGLKNFLKYLSKKSKYILIEPQPWKCYKTAIRRMKKLGCPPFDKYPNLVWRESVDTEIGEFLVKECGCALVHKLGTTEWKRTLCLFKTKNISD